MASIEPRRTATVPDYGGGNVVRPVAGAEVYCKIDGARFDRAVTSARALDVRGRLINYLGHRLPKVMIGTQLK